MVKSLRKLVVFFSYTGSTRLLAQAIANATGADIAEIHPAKPLSTFMPWVILSGGFQASTRRLVALQPLERNAEAYDMIYIGTPIWASNMAPAVRSWLAETRLRGKRIACFAAGTGVGHAFEELHAALKDNTFAQDIIIDAPLRNKADAVRRMREWALRAGQA